MLAFLLFVQFEFIIESLLRLMIRAILELVSLFSRFKECFLVILVHQFLLFELMIDRVSLSFLKNFMANYFRF